MLLLHVGAQGRHGLTALVQHPLEHMARGDDAHQGLSSGDNVHAVDVLGPGNAVVGRNQNLVRVVRRARQHGGQAQHEDRAARHDGFNQHPVVLGVPVDREQAPVAAELQPLLVARGVDDPVVVGPEHRVHIAAVVAGQHRSRTVLEVDDDHVLAPVDRRQRGDVAVAGRHHHAAVGPLLEKCLNRNLVLCRWRRPGQRKRRQNKRKRQPQPML